nr:hypothetical protein [Tanacetum cinerariifolium]
MDNPDITMEEYIQLEAKKAHRRDFDRDVLTFEQKVSSEPTISAHHAKKVDFGFVISFDESDDEDYTFTYDKNSFSYKLVFVNDLKLDSKNNDNKINIELSLEDVPIKSLDDVVDIKVNTYSNAFNENTVTNHDIPNKSFTSHDAPNKSFTIKDFVIIKTMVLFVSHAWRRLFEIREMLVRELILEFFSTCRFADGVLDLDAASTLQFQLEVPLRRLCHCLIMFIIIGRGQAPEKEESGGKMFGGHFIARLAKHFGVIIEENLRGSTMVVRDLMMIDMDELVRLRICEIFGDAPLAAPAPRIVPERLLRLEEEVHGLCDSIEEQRILLERMSSNHERFYTWVVDHITQLIHQNGLAFPRFNGRLVGSSNLSYKRRRVRQRTDGGANTSAAPHDLDQPNP